MKSSNNTNKSYVTKSFSDFDSSVPVDEAFDFLKGKARLYGDVRNAIKIATDNANSKLATPGMKDEVAKTISSLDGISKELEGKNPEDIERSDYRKYLDSINSAEDEIAKKEIEILKKNGEFNDVLKIIEDASEMAEEARKKGDEVKIQVSRKRDEKESKIELKISKTLKKNEIKGKNEEIEKVQKEFIRKFESNPKIKNSEVYKKIKNAVENKKEGGFFGPTTEKIILGLKAGFGMDDKTSDVTQELIDKIYTEKIKESEGFRTIKGFSDFDLMNEDFDAAKFLEATGEKKEEEKKSDKRPTPGELLDMMKKEVSEIYDANKDGVDYITGKDFEPTEEGKKMFRNLFRTSWENFQKYTGQQKKNTIAMGLKASIIPLIGVSKGIDKDLLDIYLKPEGKPEGKPERKKLLARLGNLKKRIS